jgi:hypothetical protein
MKCKFHANTNGLYVVPAALPMVVNIIVMIYLQK